MSSEAKRKNEIERLRKLEQHAFRQRHGKLDFYRYLEAVWVLYCEWKADRKRTAHKNQVADLYGIKLRTNTRAIRVIIDASSEQDVRVKSRWVRALQHANRNRSQVEKFGFKKFMQRNGGPAGCARKIAKDKPRRIKR